MRINSQDGRYSIEITEITEDNRVAFDAYHLDEETPFLSGSSAAYLNKVEALNAIAHIGIGLWKEGILPNFMECGETAPVESFKELRARKLAERAGEIEYLQKS